MSQKCLSQLGVRKPKRAPALGVWVKHQVGTKVCNRASTFLGTSYTRKLRAMHRYQSYSQAPGASPQTTTTKTHPFETNVLFDYLRPTTPSRPLEKFY